MYVDLCSLINLLLELFVLISPTSEFLVLESPAARTGFWWAIADSKPLGWCDGKFFSVEVCHFALFADVLLSEI